MIPGPSSHLLQDERKSYSLRFLEGMWSRPLQRHRQSLCLWYQLQQQVLLQLQHQSLGLHLLVV
jgi:hypothetical protein